MQGDLSKRNFIIVTIMVFAAFTFFGFSENIRGPTLPRIQADFTLSEFQLGLLLATNSLGYLLGCSYTAALGKKIGIKNCLIAALLGIALCGVLVFFVPNYMVLLFAFFCISLGYGMIEISLGVIAATVFKKKLGTMLNLSHFFYGVGAIFAPLAAVGVMSMRFGGQVLSWRYAYIIILSCAFVPLIPALIGRFSHKATDRKKSGYSHIMKRPVLWLIIAMLSLGALCELGTAAWLVIYLERAQDLSRENAALGLTLFFVGFTITRLLIGPLSDKIGFVNTIVIMTAFTGCMLVLGVLLGRAGIPFVVATGIGVAPIYPTVMALIAKIFPDEIDTVLTAVVTSMGIFIVAANLLLGGLINQARVVLVGIYGDSGVAMAYSAGILFIGLCGFGAFIVAAILRQKLIKSKQLV